MSDKNLIRSKERYMVSFVSWTGITGAHYRSTLEEAEELLRSIIDTARDRSQPLQFFEIVDRKTKTVVSGPHGCR